MFARAAEQLSPDLVRTVTALLAESPDPDSAILSFERLVLASAEIVRLLEQHPFLAHYSILVFGHSRYLGETLLQNTDLFPSFLRERNLDRSFSREEFQESLARFRSRSFETDVSQLLARFKRREYVRIMLRDVLRIATLAETTAEISALSDVLIEEALRDAETRLQRRYDPPQHLDADGRLGQTPFAVLAMGKLGGNELNYSSDVDLMFLFGDGEEPPTAHISNREYFIRLAQQVTEILSRVTREGPIFRIDLRLRPQGGEGELAIKLSHALRYYAVTAHDWEQQALIKVRHAAGDATLAREFIRQVQPHIYTQEINFAAIKTALVAREKMHKRHRPAALEDSTRGVDVKLDSGGIRDIEFLVQCLQRVYGGTEPWLRSGGTLFSLQKLHDKRHISGREFHDLSSAYEFVRHLEHRLQLRQGQQTHRLPNSESELRILQRSMEGYAAGEYRHMNLLALVKERMASVAEIYQRIIYQQQTRSLAEAPGKFELRSAPEFLAGDLSTRQVFERLASDAPPVYQTAARTDLSPQGRKNLFRFLNSAFTSSDRYTALLRHQEAITQALVLFECSEFLSDILIRHPEELATLADLSQIESGPDCGEELFENSLAPGRAGADPVFAYLAEYSARYGEKLALLRQHYRHCVFAGLARDLTSLRGVYHSFTASTATAENAVAAAFHIAGAPPGLAVMALGRLGSGEFDLLSDADLLFICGKDQDRQLLTRTAEQMMQALAAYTRDGMVFPVDTRLRPRGGEGELLVTSAQLESYFAHEAQAWEALMYTKMRFLTGSPSLANDAITALGVLFERFADDPSFLDAVRDMRNKLEIADRPEKSFKSSPGAIYDLDFITGFLLIKHAVPNKPGTLRDRLWRCAEQGLLERSEAAVLDHAAELLRTVEHVVRLVSGRARKWLPATEHARSTAEKLTGQILQQRFVRGLECEFDETCRRVREVYGRLMSS